MCENFSLLLAGVGFDEIIDVRDGGGTSHLNRPDSFICVVTLPGLLSNAGRRCCDTREK